MKSFIFRLFGLVALCCLGCNYAALESDKMLQKGLKLYEENKIDLALVSFKNAVDRDPTNDVALYYMALIDMHYGDYQPAIQTLENALGAAPSALYWYTLGLAQKGNAEKYFEAGQYDEADLSYTKCVRSMDQAIGMDKWYTEAHLEMARCRIGTKDYKRAAQAYQNAIVSNPNYKSEEGVTIHYKELGELYARFGLYKPAKQVLFNGLKNNLADGQLETAYADICAGMEEYSEALAHYEGAYQSLTRGGASKIPALSAMYGAGDVNFELARKDARKNPDKAREYYVQSRKWLEMYSDAALSDDERLRRSDALAKMKTIDRILAD